MARCYRLYRPPFPQTLLDDLLTRARVSPKDSLLDLACGPGRVALALAPRVVSVTAIDLEPEMIAEGRAGATERGIANVSWHIARAEDLDAASDTFQLVTIGDAFHRFDQRAILEKAKSWLAPGGAIAILRSLDTLSGAEPWHHRVRDIIAKFTDRDPAKLAAPTTAPGQVEAALKTRDFRNVATFDFTMPTEWTLESILGNLASTSYCANAVLGARADTFASEVTNVLAAFASRGALHEILSFSYTLGVR
jgi:SAM-dependent methyltransferase